MTDTTINDDATAAFSTGQRVKKSQLQKSDLFDSLLATIKGNKDSESTINLPLPGDIDQQAAISYLDYCVRRQQDYQHMLACLQSCSLLDDSDYLRYCAERFLLGYSNYKTMLSQLSPLLLEQIYLLQFSFTLQLLYSKQKAW